MLLVGAVGCGGSEPPAEQTPRAGPPEAHPTREPSPSVSEPVQLVPPPAEPCEPPARPWLQRLGGPQDDSAAGLAVDGVGDLTLVWLSTPREDEDREGVPGQRRALTVAKYGPEGQSRWSREFPRVRVDSPRVGASPDGEVFLSGNASLHAVDFGLGAAQDGFLVKLSAEGRPLWQQRVGQKAWGLATDGAGGVLVVGEEWTPGGVLPVLAHHDGEGAFRWTRQLGVVGEGSELHAVALAPSGRALLAGRLVGALAVDGRTFGEAGGQELVLLAFEADGRLAWGRELRGVEGRVTGLAVAEEGTVVLVGEHGNLLPWAGRTLSGPGAFVLAASPEGAERWGQSLSCGENPAPPVVAMEAGGRVVAACGEVLSGYAPEGTPQDSRVLSLEDCTESACRVTSTALAVLPGGGLGLAGAGRYGEEGEAWNQDAFLRLLMP